MKMNILKSKKAKIITSITCGVLVVALMATFINADTKDPTPIAENKSDKNSVFTADGLRVKREKGKWLFSTDKGKNWSSKPPEGISVDDDGSMKVHQSTEKDSKDSSLQKVTQKQAQFTNAEKASWQKPLAEISSLLKNGFSIADGLQMKFVNGVAYYSKDKGKTWSKDIPADAIESKKGEKEVNAKKEDGVWKFSTDGGKTWSEKAPEGIDVSDDGFTYYQGDGDFKTDYSTGRFRYSEDGGKTWIDPLEEVEKWLKEGFSLDDQNKVKYEDGKWYYSSDGGKTWSEEVPEGIFTNKDGVIAKKENGVWSYSNDGGKTWSDKAPDGFTFDSSNKDEENATNQSQYY